MAYTDQTTEYDYKDLATWQAQDAGAENDAYFKTGNAVVSGDWSPSGTWAMPGAWVWTPGSAIVPITITQANDDSAISIDCNSTSQNAIVITAKYGMVIISDISGGYATNLLSSVDEAGTFAILNVQSDLTNRTKEIAYINQDHASSTAIGLLINQDGDNNGISIDCESANQYGMVITAKHCLSLTSDISGGRGLYINVGVDEAGSNPLVHFYNTQTNRTEELCKIEQDDGTSTADCLEIDNDGAGAEIKFTHAITRYYAIAPSCFVPTTDLQTYVNTSDELYPRVVSLAELDATVNLPHGATITSFKVWWYRDDAAATGDIDLIRIDGVSGESIMATADSDAATGNHSVEDTSISDATIDNDAYSYTIHIKFDPNDAVSDVKFFRARIAYTISEPLP